MALARSKRTYIIAWDGCGSLPSRNGRRITAGLDRHFKTNHWHRLAFPISVLSPQDRQILKTASYMIWETEMNSIENGKDPPASVNLDYYVTCPRPRLRRVKTNDFQAINPIYVLKPFCVYSSLLLICFFHHDLSFGNHI